MAVQLTTLCPHCQAPAAVQPVQVGTQLRCARCAKDFAVTTVRSSRAGETLHATPTQPETGPNSEAKSEPPPPKETNPAETKVRKLGRFELKAVLGQGGFGRVYRAYDPQLDRYVALKVPTFSLDDNRRVVRFITEAKAAARLRHPNIVPTYESGKIGAQYYIAAQFVAGMPLSRRLRESPPDERQAVIWVRQLADALAYAHSEGIVHRDIKPDNIMLDERQMPQIMDFGLARRTDDDAVVTTDGSIMGTPAYMSPEQARGDTARVGPHSDQFSLGVLLYEMLTGKRPFEGAPHAVIALVTTAEPPTPRSIRPEIPRDLEAICLKAMEKDPARRYPDAAALSADLGRWLEGAPIVARPSRLWERAWKWSKRNPAIASLTLGILGVMLFAFVAISSALGLAITSRRQAIEQRNAAETASKEAKGLAENLAQQKSELQQTLDNLRAERKRADAKTAEVSQLDSELQKVQGNIAAAEERMKQAQAAEKLAASKAAAATAQADAALERVALETRRAQKLLAKSYLDLGLRRCEDGNVAEGALWLVRSLESLPEGDEEQTGTIRAALAQHLVESTGAIPPRLRLALAHEHPVTAADYHPQEPLVVSGDDAGQITLWDTKTGEKLHTAVGHSKRIRFLRFAPGESGQFATGGEDSQLIVWRITKERRLEVLSPKMQNQFPVTAAAWSGGGRWLLAGSEQARRMQLWNAGTRRVAGGGFGNEDPGRIFALAMHPSEEKQQGTSALALVGTGLLEKTVRLWDVLQGKPLPGKAPLAMPGDVRAVTFNPPGTLAVATTSEKKAVLVDIANWALLKDPIDLPGRAATVAWSATQPLILFGCDDRSALLWDVLENAQRGDALLHNGPVHGVQFHAGGDEFLTASDDQTLRLWNLPRSRQRREIDVGKPIDAIALSPDGRRLVAATGRDISVWSTDSRSQIAEIRDKTVANYSLAFAPHARTILVGDARSARLWSTSSWKAIGVEMPHADRVLDVAYSRDGKWLATASADHTARLWNAETQAAFGAALNHPDRVTAIDLHPSATHVVTGCEDHLVRIWDHQDFSKPLHAYKTTSVIHSVAFADHGRLVAAGCDDGSVHLIGTATGKLEGAPLESQGVVRRVVFEPGATMLCVGSSAGTASWSVSTRQRISKPVSLSGQLQALAASADGRSFAALADGKPGVVAVWHPPEPLPESREWLAARVQVATGRQLSPSGAVTALTAAELKAAQERLAAFARAAQGD